MVIDIVIMICNEIKFDDITVTSQSNNPSSPIIEIDEKAQHIIGKTTHRFLLKTSLSATRRIKKTPKPKTFKSFLT